MLKARHPLNPNPMHSGSLRAVVKRADGSIENRGIVSYSHRNPVLNFVGGNLARFNGWLWERYYRSKKRIQTWRNSSST